MSLTPYFKSCPSLRKCVVLVVILVLVGQVFVLVLVTQSLRSP